MRTEEGSSKLPTQRGHFVSSEMNIFLTFVSLWATTNWVDELPGSEDPGLGGMLYCFLFVFYVFVTLVLMVNNKSSDNPFCVWGQNIQRIKYNPTDM